MKKSIVLCADDYGQAPAISEAIINLLENHRLSATSCMVNTSYWAEHAKWLAPLHQQADIGLHFNLTEGKALSPEYRRAHGDEFRPLMSVMRSALKRAFSRVAIEAELHAQIDQFQEALGFLPDHMDGHQHIHQFPIIREAVIHVYEQRLRAKKAYIRLIKPPIRALDLVRNFKKIIIYAMGTGVMEKLLLARNIPHNQSFSGIVAFGRSSHYPLFFKEFLQGTGDRGLIMCHPGYLAVKAGDRIAGARFDEYRYLAGSQFIEDCESSRVSIRRFREGLVL